MILHTASENATVEGLAAEMVRLSMDRRESVCSIYEGIPLVTYPNDARSRAERIKNITLSFMDGLLRSKMVAYPIPAGQPCDTRFDPQFRCESCEAAAARAQMLEEMLAALAGMARQKLPDDEEIAAMTSAATTILMGSALQEKMAEKLRKLIRP